MAIAAICGPTAAGKTALAVRLRRDHGLPVEMVSVDALQVYRRLDAGTAKPTPEERQLIQTHLVDIVEPTEAMNAALWVAAAEQALTAIRARGGWPLLVGGTGLYLRALRRGLAAIPPIPQALREELAHEHAARGPLALWEELAQIDPAYAVRTPAANRQRVLRALEVYRATGQPFSAFHAAHAAQPDRHACLCISLEPPSAALHQRIRQRARAMAGPLLAEVAALRRSGLTAAAPGLQAIGYREAWDAVEHHEMTDAFGERLVSAHLAYAKRQATWFRGNPAEIRAVDVDPPAIAAALRRWFTAT